MGAGHDETVRFAAADGTDLVGDLRRPDGAGVRAAAIICHPHPQYGGNRFNNVVEACFDALPSAGVAALRFDFRRPFDGGPGERLDALAALDTVAAAVPGVPLVAVGYSFGAAITAALTVGDDRPTLAAVALIAPPFGAMEVEAEVACPTLVITAEHDQFAPPAIAEPVVRGWPGATDHLTFEYLPMSDHFFVGRASAAADLTVAWLLPHLPASV